MDFFETADDVEQQLADVHHKLEAIHGDVSRPVAIARLKNENAFHPILMLRGVFLGAVVLCTVLAFVAFLVPFFAGFLDPKIPSTILQIQSAMGGTPLPIAIAGGAGLLVIAWFAVDRAAVAFGRGATLTAVEAREADRLNSEMTRLMRQRDLIHRANATPVNTTLRYDVPDPNNPNLPSQYEEPRAAPSYLQPAPVPSMPPQLNTRPDGTPTPVPSRHRSADDGYARFRTPATNGREVVPIPKPTTISLTPSDTMRGAIEGPTDQFPENGPTKTFSDSPYVIEDATDQPTASTHQHDVQYVVDTHSQQGSFDRRTSSEVPALARVSEPWLQDAIAKATVLADSFPMQARLEFSQAKHLPFTLALERATPAMAVRAMMAYVEFLSTIATPRRGRIELLSVAHLDRTFHRNVRAACTPYFEQGVRISNEPGRIEITFEGPDARWDRYPMLPISP